MLPHESTICVSFKWLIISSLYVGTSEKAMAPHSSTLAWKIPWTEEPGGLQSMGSRRVRHDCTTSLLLFTFMHWRRKWEPTPVFLPGEPQGRGCLVGCRLWGRKELDTTEATQQQQQQQHYIWYCGFNFSFGMFVIMQKSDFREYVDLICCKPEFIQ